MLYRICNKNSGKCLGVVGGGTGNANVEQRAYTAAAGQTWPIAQPSSGLYKIINKTSGMSLDVNGSQVVQRPYAGQAVPDQLLTRTSPGFGNLKTERLEQRHVDRTGRPTTARWSTTVDSGQASADAAKWSFTAIGPIALDPGKSYKLSPKHAPTKTIDIANGSTANGTAVQEYDSLGRRQPEAGPQGRGQGQRQADDEGEQRTSASARRATRKRPARSSRFRTATAAMTRPSSPARRRRARACSC